MAAAAVMTPLGPVVAWLRAPARKDWAWPLALALVGALVFLPLDGPINRLVKGVKLGGDIKREAEFIQQYGQFTCIVITLIIIGLVDTNRERARRVLDWLAAMAVSLVAVNILKIFFGRPRPKFDDPWGFIGLFDKYAIPGVGLRHSWEIGRGISSSLWSMPSSHTVYAVVMSVVLAKMYPRLRVFAIAMAIIVGLCRVLLGAHYMSDVIVGAALGWIIATAAMDHRWGQRVLGPRTARA